MKNYILILFSLAFTQSSFAQISKIDSSKYPKISIFTTQQDHDNMKATLGIKNLRSGPSGNESAPNHANYDETLATLSTPVGATGITLWQEP